LPKVIAVPSASLETQKKRSKKKSEYDRLSRKSLQPLSVRRRNNDVEVDRLIWRRTTMQHTASSSIVRTACSRASSFQYDDQKSALKSVEADLS
jgi:hypothetical protein